MISTLLTFYKNSEIPAAMAQNAAHREVAVKFGEKGFGKRPDVITYPNEIVSLVQDGATSFHASEELWSNPTLIQTGMKKAEVEKLRTGWDLLIDIDAPVWEISRLTAWLVINALQSFGITSVSVKFSGNKGFHIGVPFEAFPSTYNGQETQHLFPEAPRAIATYLLNYIKEEYIDDSNTDKIIFGKGLSRQFSISYDKLQKLTGKSFEDLTTGTGAEKKAEKKADVVVAEDELGSKQGKMLELEKLRSQMLPESSSEQEVRVFNPLSIIEVDTILISSRHLFRMPYSFHEKSGLVSLPFNPDKILLFEKKFADPRIAKVSSHVFLDRTTCKPGEAADLLSQAMSYVDTMAVDERKSGESFEYTGDAIPEAAFPPSIVKILEGLEDGRKRGLFILTNFLQCVGWTHEMIENRIKEWNEKNAEPLRETNIVGHLRYKKNHKEKVLPPNYDKDYYSGIGITPTPEELRYKNPIKYAMILSKRMKKK